MSKPQLNVTSGGPLTYYPQRWDKAKSVLGHLFTCPSKKMNCLSPSAFERETPIMKYRSLLTVLVVCFLVPWPVDADDDVFDSNGVKIRYVTEGKGEPVVLIHGWMADSSMWG